ncbi:SPOR domain-containing protein [Methylobacterium fujisawaense]
MPKLRRLGTGALVWAGLQAALCLPASALDEGIWVVAGSFRNVDNANFQSEAVARATAAVKRCGLQPFNDFSGKFGFAEGFDVVVVGPYRTRSEAERILGRLRPCVPDAYLKRGRYLGE